MKATKLKSGNWRARAFYIDENGKQHRKSFTAPTRKEAEFLANTYTYVPKVAPRGARTLKQAIERYVEVKTGVLSPTTLLDYERMINHFSEEMLNTQLSELSAETIDLWIQEQAKKVSPKTVQNRYGLLNTVCKYHRVVLDKRKLPQKKKIIYKIPKDAEVKKLLKYAKSIGDSELELIILLGAFGCMRRGEMCGLTPGDLNGTKLHIHMNKVQVKNGTVTKTTKNESSDRVIDPPQVLIKFLKKRDEFIVSAPSTVSKKFKRALKACGLPNYRLHDLRHYCASVMAYNGCPIIYTQHYGGWKDDRILREIYLNVMEDYNEKYSKTMDAVFAGISS